MTAQRVAYTAEGVAQPAELVTARDIMTRPVTAATRTTTLRDVAIQMFLGGISGMPVTERDGKIVGIVTELDIIRGIRSGLPMESTKAEKVMTPHVITVDADDTVDRIIDVLEQERILRVPVTEDGKLVGIVARPDILRAFVEPNFMSFE